MNLYVLCASFLLCAGSMAAFAYQLGRYKGFLDHRETYKFLEGFKALPKYNVYVAPRLITDKFKGTMGIALTDIRRNDIVDVWNEPNNEVKPWIQQ